MATPGITCPLLLVVSASTPAAPPQKAISTSYSVGDVRASSSLLASLMGDNMKYTVAVSTEISAATP